MPIYEYRCSDCGFQDEFLQKISEPPMTVCPSCGKASLKKLLSAAGFQLKGSGWYATDFKGGGSNSAGKPGTQGKSAKEGGGATQGESAGSSSSADKAGGDSSASGTAKTPPVAASN